MSRVPYKSCPMCGGTESELYALGNMRNNENQYDLDSRIEWRICRCNHIYTTGYFADEAFEQILNKSLPSQEVGAKYEEQRHIVARGINQVVDYLNHGKWLDVGFGNGSVLFTAHEYGFEPVGLDIRPKNVEDMRAIGVEAHCSTIEDFDQGDFSVISLLDVLEHIPFPVPTLKEIYLRLVPGGMFYLSTPNAGSILWDMYNKAGNPYLDEVEHYHIFNRKRLYSVLKEIGFNPVRYAVSDRYKCCMEILAIKT